MLQAAAAPLRLALQVWTPNLAPNSELFPGADGSGSGEAALPTESSLPLIVAQPLTQRYLLLA